MKKFELTKTAQFDERLQLMNVVRGSPTGYSIDDVRKALVLLKKIEGSDTTLELENDEWEFLCGLLKNTRWVVAMPEVIEMYDKIVGPIGPTTPRANNGSRDLRVNPNA